MINRYPLCSYEEILHTCYDEESRLEAHTCQTLLKLDIIERNEYLLVNHELGMEYRVKNEVATYANESSNRI